MENVFLNVFTMKELGILFDVLNLAAVHSENAAGLVADDRVREEIARYKSNPVSYTHLTLPTIA